MNWSGAALIEPRRQAARRRLADRARSASAGDAKLPGNMFVPIDALKPILADLVHDGPARRSGAAVARRRRRRRCRAGCWSRACRRTAPATRPASRPATSSSASAARACARRPSSTARCGAAARAGADIPLRVLQGVDVKELDGPLDRPRRVLPAARRRTDAPPRSRRAGCRARRRSAASAVASRRRSGRMRGFAAFPRARGRLRAQPFAPMLLYAATIFVSAFLLFLVQPIIAKQILPWFGGSAAVWTTCLVFFQTALLAGYAYSRSRRAPARARARRSSCTRCCSSRRVAVLPIIPGAHWKPLGHREPVVADPRPARRDDRPAVFPAVDDEPAGAGLVRAGASRREPVPAVRAVEPRVDAGARRLSVPARAVGADAHAGVGLVGRLRALRRSLRRRRLVEPGASARNAVASRVGLASEPTRNAPSSRRRPLARQALWCALAATGSLLLLAVSNHITQNIAAVPLLWIVPLAIYLLTFILCFDGKGWYRRDIFLAMLAAGLGVMAWTLADSKFTHELALQIGVFCAGLFLACMFCHGELVRLKPAPAYLTRFYLMISLGGALGSALVGIVAPLVLPAYFELAGGLVVAALLLLWQVRPAAHRLRRARRRRGADDRRLRRLGRSSSSTTARSSPTRNFYGVLRVQEWSRDTRQSPPVADPRHDPARHAVPGARISPAADDLLHATRPASGCCSRCCIRRTKPLKVGVIGLGTGTLGVLRRQGRRLSLLRHQPGRDDASRSATSRTSRTATRRSRSRWATRACRSSASRRSSSTCSRSTRSRATRFRCTSSRPKRSAST